MPIAAMKYFDGALPNHCHTLRSARPMKMITVAATAQRPATMPQNQTKPVRCATRICRTTARTGRNACSLIAGHSLPGEVDEEVLQADRAQFQVESLGGEPAFRTH